MCDNVCIEVNETVENISIDVRDFSILNIISEDANNSATIGSDGLLFVPKNTAGGTVTSVNGILPDVGGNVVVPIPNVPDFADQTEVNDGIVVDKVIAPNTLAGWWTYVKGLAQTFAQKITFSSGALFTPQPAPTYERGRVYFDDVNDCVSFMDSIPGTSVQVGYEVLMRARNNTGATITNGSVVYISGAIGQNSTVALAQSNTLPTSEIIGIATHNIANNTVGKICVFGLVNDLNTSSFTDGQMLYLSATVAGGLTSTIPASPNFLVALGVVEHAHPTQGKILVRPQRALANNNSLGTAQNVPPTQNAVKTALDLKADLVGGKVPASQLPSYVDDVIEGYFNGTNFYTDALFTNLITPESGKIYVALDTNLQYRWSGSAYVQIGGDNDLYPIKYWYQATGGGVLQTYGTNAIFAIGTQSDVVGVISYRKYLTTTALGNLAIVRESSFPRINSNRGFHYEMRFKLENTASAPDWRGFFGFRTTSIPTNVNPSDDLQPLLGIGADATDTNLFFISKFFNSPIVKVDTGILKSTTDELLLEIKRLNGTNSNKLTLKNLSTGDMVTTFFDNNEIRTITNYVSNNASAQAIGFSISRIRLNISE